MAASLGYPPPVATAASGALGVWAVSWIFDWESLVEKATGRGILESAGAEPSSSASSARLPQGRQLKAK